MGRKVVYKYEANIFLMVFFVYLVNSLYRTAIQCIDECRI